MLHQIIQAVQAVKDSFDEKSANIPYGNQFSDKERELYAEREAAMDKISKEHGEDAWKYINDLD